jgi:hypothetical protein
MFFIFIDLIMNIDLVLHGHHVQKDNFEFVEDGDHEAQDQCSL